MRIGQNVLVTSTAECCRRAGFIEGREYPIHEIILKENTDRIEQVVLRNTDDPDKDRLHNFNKDQVMEIIKTKKMTKNIKAKAVEIRTAVKPYEKYIFMTALLLAVDHFILKGKTRVTITKLAKKFVSKISGVLNNCIEKIG